MSTTTYSETQTLHKVTCCNCHVLFAMPQDMYERRRDDHQSFYCPNGHSQHYTGPNIESELRAKLVRAEAEAANQKRWQEFEERRRKEAEANLATQKMKTLAEKSAKARLQKRIANGACPCCHRQFQNVRQHIADMHPTFVLEAHGAPEDAIPKPRRGRPPGSRNRSKG